MLVLCGVMRLPHTVSLPRIIGPRAVIPGLIVVWYNLPGNHTRALNISSGSLNTQQVRNGNHWYIHGLVQDCSHSSALALELLQSCTKPLIYQYFKSSNPVVTELLPIDQIHKSHNTPVPNPTMQHSDQKSSYLCSKRQGSTLRVVRSSNPT